MANQSPMISIPKKSTEEVDWTNPIRTLIAQSYGENPDNYTTEYSLLQRCRQDAVRGAGSDITARDLLYKYFGQLELLELRFSEIRVNFPWRDAFTSKLTTQTSIAYEKASVLFQIASTHSAIASSQNRGDPEGLKRAFHYFRTCAGMLTYINENFLHAPSTDLSRDVIKFLVGIILAQATEVFFEKCTDERKGNVLMSKVGAQAASMYSSLSEEVKEWMGKGIFDRNWVTLIQIKSKYFTSLSQYYRALADDAAGKHGDALVRLTVAEKLAKEASTLASTFSAGFSPSLSPTLPADAGPTIQERTKAHLALCTDRKAEAQRENDLIYNAILPAAEALAPIDKTAVATPIPIQEVYGTAEVQKTIGSDIFIRLIPLSVHESASVYSEEKAKLVRAEVELADQAEGEMSSAIDGLGVKDGLLRFKAMADGAVASEQEIPLDVRRWREDISVIEEKDGVDSVLTQLHRLKENVQRDVDAISRDLEIESKDCEMMRVKYEHLWTQAPSASLTKPYRQELKSILEPLESAAATDGQVVSLWSSIREDIHVLLSAGLEDVFRASTECAGSANEHLLDLDLDNVTDDAQERAKIGGLVDAIEERLGSLNKISRERNEVLKDLKEKVQNDDVSHLLLLNRRNTGVEPTLFATELEKFRPYQQRLAACIHQQAVTIQELTSLWKTLKELAGRGPGVRKWEEREKRKRETVQRFQHARDTYMEIRDGLAQGLPFYHDLGEVTTKLRSTVKEYVAQRTTEREALAGQIETEKRLSVPSAPPPLARKPVLPPPPPASNLDSRLASLSLGTDKSTSPPVPPPPPASSSWQVRSPPPVPPNYAPHTGQSPPASVHPYGTGAPAAPVSYTSAPSQRQASTPWLPPPPPPVSSQLTSPPPASDPYANLGMFSPASYSTSGSSYTAASASAPQPLPSSSQSQYAPPLSQSQYTSPPPPPLPQHHSSNTNSRINSLSNSSTNNHTSSPSNSISSISYLHNKRINMVSRTLHRRRNNRVTSSKVLRLLTDMRGSR
ncbi:vacuolar protein-sorting protein BRO1 [Fistulina hepatica ATCC 64428]|uniref:BRO domain-containing protein 1 n=1 Tax=Fistulina hepatica ATCC 64428 TaxID=1128425 RepID=A0A0D7AG76_9AGAR|nr:vacuolar protein-sorting protein BRO1 [Fistulina hepatica ATCC 64428]